MNPAYVIALLIAGGIAIAYLLAWVISEAIAFCQHFTDDDEQ